jgi:hypothetical protein
VQVEQQFADGMGVLAVEVPGRLVGQQQRRLLDERARDGHSLPFAAGEFGRPVVESVCQSHALEQLPGVRLRVCGARVAVDQRGNQHVLQHRTLREKVVVLEDEADPPVPERGQLAVVQRERVRAVEPHCARGRSVERAEDVQQRALAGPGRPRHHDRVAAVQRERHAAQHGQRPGAGRVLL